MENNKHPYDIFEPPGGILVWIVIFLELTTFGLASIFMTAASTAESALFHLSSRQLNPGLGTVYTMVLLISGYYIAASLRCYKWSEWKRSAHFMQLAMLFGLVFLLLKGAEFSLKISEGNTLGSNTFYTYYWLLTGFHFIHVLVGMIILLILYRTVFKAKTGSALENFDAGAAFWHMCDLIWLMIFPLLYLFF